MGRSMSAVEILADLAQLGVQLKAHGDRLRFFPRSAVTTEMAERLRSHKHELLAVLRVPAPVRGQSTIHCPDCRSANLLETDAGVQCGDCGAMAWIQIGREMVRADVAAEDRRVIDPPSACAVCGVADLWQSLAGNWHCRVCDPPTVAQRIRKLAARLRTEDATRARRKGETS